MQTYKVRDLIDIVIYYNGIKITEYHWKAKYQLLKERKKTQKMRNGDNLFIFYLQITANGNISRYFKNSFSFSVIAWSSDRMSQIYTKFCLVWNLPIMGIYGHENMYRRVYSNGNKI
jgi:hypothetical protein